MPRRTRAPRPPSTKRNAVDSERPRIEEDGVIARRRVKALDLAIAGASYRQIAAQLTISLAQAWEDVQAELMALNAVRQEKAEQLRDLALRRLDKWTLALTPKAQAGNEKAVRVLVQIEDRRAKLLGLDAATKLEHSGPGGAALRPTVLSSELLIAMEQELLSRSQEAPADD